MGAGVDRDGVRLGREERLPELRQAAAVLSKDCELAAFRGDVKPAQRAVEGQRVRAAADGRDTGINPSLRQDPAMRS